MGTQMEEKSATKMVDSVILQDNILNKLIRAEVYKVYREMVKEKYIKFKELKWIKFTYDNFNMYYNTVMGYAIPVRDSYGPKESKVAGRAVAIPGLEMLKPILESIPEEIANGIRQSDAYGGRHYIGINDRWSYCWEDRRVDICDNSRMIHLNMVEIPYAEFMELVTTDTYRIIGNDVFDRAVKVIHGRELTDIDENEIDQLVDIFSLDRDKIISEVTDCISANFTMTEDLMRTYTEDLLACDAYRAELERYDLKCLEDVNMGHWELWNDKEPQEKQVCVKLGKKLVARNPLADIHEDGLIGIDFGTKSTIVSRRDGSNKVNLMRIGIGQLNKSAEAYHYENPTIMEFVDFEKFLGDYKSRDGRPNTSINDLTVSHKADNSLKNCSESDFFYSYFYDIKQWCGDTERKIKLIDQKGEEKLLSVFTDLEEDDFNPLELYAYYLGLYINNMRNGIYLDYILSFPVTYKKAVKEKILESFTKGLKKSLPESVLNDQSAMERYRVRQGVSEPAAYAITALQGYGFEPDEDENILYAIFDFGGGTTDFDFGVWRGAGTDRTERRYDYVIEHFGSEGDMYLGGENLLELMAYEIFKANAPLLQTGVKKNSNDKERQVGFSFSKPRECEAFAGSETLISNSQEAKRNTKQLMEALRPFW